MTNDVQLDSSCHSPQIFLFLTLRFIRFLIRFDYTPTDDEIEQVCLSLDRKLEIPCNFIQTAPCFEPGERPVTAYPIVSYHLYNRSL